MEKSYNPSALFEATAKMFGADKSVKQEVKLFSVPKIESLQDMVRQTARKYADKLAMEDLTDTPIGRVTYGTLLKDILKFGSALKKLGIPERSHIAVIGENRVQWGISYLTAMCFNYVIVPIDKNLSMNEILNIIHESESVAIIFSDSFDPTLRERIGSEKSPLLHQYGSADEEGWILFDVPVDR
jgi:long-chain acyl-CoA synthetase